MAATKSKPPADLLQHLAGVIDTRLKPEQSCWIGLSGGRDSVVLLHALAQLRPGCVSAIHVHHGLSPNAEAWAGFCQTCCDALGVPLRIARVNVDHARGEGLEGAARHARYHAFAQLGQVMLCLAHHREDQAETVLFNLLRGAGVHGAAGMRLRRRHGDLDILRPLLALPRASVEAYAQAWGLRWIEDESNRDTRFSRNYLRQTVLPGLLERFPAGAGAMARAASHFAEAADLLDELGAADLAATGHEGGIGLKALLGLPFTRQKNLLRYFLRQAGQAMPDVERLAEALRQLANIQSDNHFVFTLNGTELRVWREALYLIPQLAAPLSLSCTSLAPLLWAGGEVRFEQLVGQGISLAKLGDLPLSLRCRQGGEALSLGAGRPTRLLKKFLQEFGLPPWLRERLPLLFAGETLVWCHGIGVAGAWQAGPEEAGLVPRWQLPEGTSV